MNTENEQETMAADVDDVDTETDDDLVHCHVFISITKRLEEIYEKKYLTLTNIKAQKFIFCRISPISTT